jgi:hypothetical protein
MNHPSTRMGFLVYRGGSVTRVLESNNCKLEDCNGEPDHVHLLIDLHPNNNISEYSEKNINLQLINTIGVRLNSGMIQNVLFLVQALR